MNVQAIFIALGMLGVSVAGCNDAKTQTETETTTATTVQQKKTNEIISSEKLQSILAENPDVQLVDVRTVEEFESGHLANAKNISINDADFESRMGKLDKSAPVYVYCRSGGRSARACGQLEEMGFVELYDLKGGITAWQGAGMSVEQ